MLNPPNPSRREVLQSAAAVTGGMLLPSCAHTSAGPALPAAPALPGSLTVKGTRFIKDGKPFFVSGFNYWAGPTLARDGNQAGWDQVRRDLDGLQKAGINMIRTCVATEGPDTEPFRIVPTIQPAMGQYDPAGVGGVMRFAEEVAKRGLYTIMMLNNFWQWSGGFAQYLSWAGAGPIPYPPPAPNGNWDRFQHFVGGFYTNDKAVAASNAYISFLVPKLAQNPVLIWELANEPRGMKNVGVYRKWIDSTARLIKSLSPSQLVTTGSEGQTQTPVYAGLNVVDDHQSAAIDFICFHMWAANWNWIHKENLAGGYPKALERAKKYINEHAAAAAKVGKPILLEEFGFPRDGGSFDPASPVTLRDQYFQEVYALVHSLLPTTPMAGIMPWAWAGDARPLHPGQYWKPGEPFIGDPPHEEQGWYSVFDKDTTLKLITDWSPRIVGTAVTS
jgi:mannan endo-1,4-beta-mannosidase